MFNVFTTFVSMPTFKKTFTDGAKGKKAFQLLVDSSSGQY